MTVKISFKYLVPSALADNARFVKDANTAKKVAFKCAGAFWLSMLKEESLRLVPKEILEQY